MNINNAKTSFFILCNTEGFDKAFERLCNDIYKQGVIDGDGLVIYTDGANDHILVKKGISKYGSRQ